MTDTRCERPGAPLPRGGTSLEPTPATGTAEITTRDGSERSRSRRAALHTAAIALLAALGLREVAAKQDRAAAEQHRNPKGHDHGKRGKRGKRGPGGAPGGSGPQGGKGEKGGIGPIGPSGNPGVLWARVDGIGRDIGQKGVTSVTRTGSGSYHVTFSDDVSACAVTLTPIHDLLSLDPDPIESRLFTIGADALVRFKQGFSNLDVEFSIVANCG
jgi:hypothetical protein